MKDQSFSTTQLKDFGIDESLYKNFQLVFLPENFYQQKELEELSDAENSIELYKYLKSKGLKVGNSIDLGITSKVIERRGEEFWFGLINFLQDGSLNIFWGLLGSYLFEKINSKKFVISGNEKEIYSQEKQNENSDYMINIKVITKKYTIDYRGNVDDFVKIIDSLKS